jgi:hypothetical protein
MTTMHFTETTTASAGEVVAALTDFGPTRSEVFANSQPEYLKVHSSGPTTADVTEGSKVGGGVWERLTYDWSVPNTVRMTTTDSNTWGGRSGHVYTMTPTAGGTTSVDVVVVREGKNVKGKALAVVLALGGKSLIRKELRKSLAAIEARSS